MFDLNELPNCEEDAFMDENVSNSVENLESEDLLKSSTQVQPYFKTQLILDPFKGQTFLSEEEACMFYQNYARFHGFSIRKDRIEKKAGKNVRRDFFCHRGGSQPLKEIDLSKEQRNRVSLKCNCNAHIRIKLRRNNEIFPEEWHVINFIKDHNHALLSQAQVKFLPANRVISSDDKQHILLLKEAGLTVRQIIRVLELEKGVEHGDLPFLEKDIRNLFTQVRKSISGDDVGNLLHYFKYCHEKNHNFQYVVKVDNDNKLEHLFWSPAPCFEWYDRYGDIVVFDTTYKVNIYNMPCAFFVGINNHGKTILFGCALLRNETVDSFRWLMKTFVTIMKKAPKTIMTDQDPWMTQAIAEELPHTKHAFCIWHITSKFSGWFTSILREQYQDWCKDFYTLYKLETIEDFEKQWPLIVKKYNLEDNKHVKGLYQIKNFWVPAYLRDHYFGDTRTTGRSEFINGFIKKFVSSTSTLKDLAKQVDVAILEIIHKQSHDNMVAASKMGVLKIKSPWEEQASQVLTPFAFEKFRDECSKSSHYSILSADRHDFVVRYYAGEHARSRQIYWDGNVASCTCKQFEFTGILCRHIFRVFIQSNCHKIPLHYLPTRWHLEENFHPTQFVEGQSSQVNGEFGEYQSIQVPPVSRTKGRPKNKRPKGGMELAKQTRCCSKCKKPGHYANKCFIDKENAPAVNGPPNKKKKNVSTNENLNPVYNVKC